MFSGRYRVYAWVDRMITVLWNNQSSLSDKHTAITEFMPQEARRRLMADSVRKLDSVREGLAACVSFRQFERMILATLCGEEFIALNRGSKGVSGVDPKHGKRSRGHAERVRGDALPEAGESSS